ncbi:carbon-nitrogen hydrolase family protein [Sulfitobacter geojensis]|uniref:Carbon-nitrogen hydrolase family protein n=1 Tax=Sulfitobacter geojensis TaxID=1342299 RepID=A0AAE3B6T3_9RHOB|nr:carbon-nitrogen hydrolase family protein [Sulfitobacter geojensis]MBM1690033.1 carbon-nitrogen hydrolase family protein [Sulfitobacter geojensis]MBM1694099.1 carbon-nitrogen hydrolase family protein [Sulfitobacter geojensis]MBM1706265.1 carbon-nitrogen hydrolase family protein [Sulfitobacter geojensis]MBM1710323.1 carbon-nitrogen hydrolase family protein [Sulfitobacter geojensis]MBM1714389.1 carbon-nitrogen hydrolase family protein [Sulfitobacter geojensis]
MKIATAAYPLDVLTSWAQYEDKLAGWVAQAAGQGAELLVFPEYGAMELATLDGLEVAGDLERSLFAVSDRLADADAVHVRLAAEYGVHIVAASAPAATETRPVNRARLITPTGQIGVQDKQIMTRFEEEVWDVVPGNPLQVFDTTLGKIGILICYDSEFPLLGRALAECDVICVPSVTETLAGYWRVRIGTMARALENQCITAMSSVVGAAGWSDALGTSFGAGGIYCPPDRGFPDTGVLAAGVLNDPVWTYADVDLAQVAEVRRDGIVLNRKHWDHQNGRDAPAPSIRLR